MSHPPTTFTLTAEQLAQYDCDGYLVIPNFFSASTASILKEEADSLIASIDLASHPRTIFSSKQSGEQTVQANASNSSSNSGSGSGGGGASDKECDNDDKQCCGGGAGSMLPLNGKNDYFLDSADRISYFFEEGAVDAGGNLTVPLEKSINKIGHYLHILNPAYHEFTYSPSLKGLVRSLGFHRPIVLQSMIICKQPQIGGEVVKHRDSTFLFTVPSTAIGCWFALEDCTTQNGCLYFVPGSHKDGASTKRFVRKGLLKGTLNNEQGDEGGPLNHGVELGFVGEDKRHYDDAEFKAEPVTKGSLILINGEVVHWSSHNRSDKSRFIYTFHLIEGEGTTYPKENWLQSKLPFPTLY